MGEIPAKDGNKAIKFKTGGLHQSLNVAPHTKIPASKMQAALSGQYGEKARKEAQFSKNVLTGGRK